MTEVLISGPEGRIEARYRHGEKFDSGVALILHPDPTRGGSINTKVVINKKVYFIIKNRSF